MKRQDCSGGLVGALVIMEGTWMRKKMFVPVVTVGLSAYCICDALISFTPGVRSEESGSRWHEIYSGLQAIDTIYAIWRSGKKNQFV